MSVKYFSIDVYIAVYNSAKNPGKLANFCVKIQLVLSSPVGFSSAHKDPEKVKAPEISKHPEFQA